MAAIALMVAMGFTSCNTADDDTPTEITMLATAGAYIINNGSADNYHYSTLSYLDYYTLTDKQDIYEVANQGQLDNNTTDAAICGSKLYLVASDSKSILVTNKDNTKKITSIPTNGVTPRHIAANGAYVYVSTYDSKVLAIDTISNTIQKTYSCGAHSEGIASFDKYVVVADCSDGESNGSLSVINLASGETMTFKSETIVNPTDVMIYPDQYGVLHIYYIDLGKNDDKRTGYGMYELLKDGNTRKIINATMASISPTGVVYAINAPQVTPAVEPSYIMYDLYSGITKQFITGKDIAAPAAIAVDPTNTSVVITSHILSNGAPEKSAPGYACIYSPSGSLIKKLPTGTNPVAICFRWETVKVQLE